jgi:hypothetical protein
LKHYAPTRRFYPVHTMQASLVHHDNTAYISKAFNVLAYKFILQCNSVS